jgi:hypothetical protein
MEALAVGRAQILIIYEENSESANCALGTFNNT